MKEKKITWEEVYKKLAEKVLEYKDNRKELLRIMYEMLEECDLFNDDVTENCNLDRKNGVRVKYDDIDPFSFMKRFSIYSNDHILSLIKKFEEKTGMDIIIPDNLNGLPIAKMKLNTFFIRFSDEREEHDIDNLWDLFVVAMNYPNDNSLREEFIKKYDIVVKMPNCLYNISTELYKMNPYFYVSLDSTNRSYIKEKFNLAIDKCPSGEEYLRISEYVKNRINQSDEFISFTDFSHKAWEYKNKEKEKYFILTNAYNSLLDKAIKLDHYFYWQNKPNINVNDIVYIYYSGKSIKYEAIVIEKDIDIDTIDTKIPEWFLNGGHKKYMKLKPIRVVQNDILSYANWKDKGLKNRFQLLTGFEIEDEELKNYIKDVFDNEGKKVDMDYINEIKIENRNNQVGVNRIYYGTPGCGKSKEVENIYCKNEENYIRTTFYPDYTNSDFVGQIVPKVRDEKIYYEVEAGPFTKILYKALNNENENYVLIIEEINRGNASAIFGDIFQLLDRDETGNSVYNIENNIIEQYFKQKNNYKEELEDKSMKIKIPKNLSIIGTMNTSDQNVYTLDTAFKRRWELIKIRNDFKNHEYANMYVPDTEVTWERFVDKINNNILDLNSFGINSEDKQIGQYFVQPKDLSVNKNSIENGNKKRFAEKVLMYLWDDVASLNRTSWFKNEYRTLDELLDGFENIGLGVFKDIFNNETSSEEKSHNE